MSEKTNGQKLETAKKLLENITQTDLNEIIALLEQKQPKPVPEPIVAKVADVAAEEKPAKKPAKLNLDGVVKELDIPMWYDKCVMYQIYPIGFCGAPRQNDQKVVPRINKVLDIVPHLKKLMVSAVYFSPVFSSDNHGYDTRDYCLIDERLGTNKDFAGVCDKLHESGIRVILDGVFNHVGRGFFGFEDLKKNRENSQYKDWFIVNFGGNSNYNDGFWYEGWEGHFELVKLNLKNPAVVDYLLSCVKKWIDEFNIDGLRLDVAYSLEPEFLKRLRSFCKGIKNDFYILGEMLHGDYNRLVNPEMLDSCTNYECYKGLFSSLNSNNMFELAHSLNRQFGGENWSLYKGKNLVCFGDNHDVSRLASILTDENNLKVAYGLLFSMPGTPCIYYGSEWGQKGSKSDGDDALRPEITTPIFNELSEYIKALAVMKRSSKALCVGDFKNLHIASNQLAFSRECDGERVISVSNSGGAEASIPVSANSKGISLLTGEVRDINGSITLPPYSFDCFRLEN